MSNSLQALAGQTDIYLLDQIMKGRYQSRDIILDAGCGSGRNLHWFLNEKFTMYGIDNNASALQKLRDQHPSLPENRFLLASLYQLPFEDHFFNHIICSAVLHFSESIDDFYASMKEMARVLKPGGSLFIRMTSDIGIEDKVSLIGEGNYWIPDGSKRFLLTKKLLDNCLHSLPLVMAEPLKTVNVADVRCMTTLVLVKSTPD